VLEQIAELHGTALTYSQLAGSVYGLAAQVASHVGTRILLPAGGESQWRDGAAVTRRLRYTDKRADALLALTCLCLLHYPVDEKIFLHLFCEIDTFRGEEVAELRGWTRGTSKSQLYGARWPLPQLLKGTEGKGNTGLDVQRGLAPTGAGHGGS
jgi:hypothetical protein